jgi:ligand-binding sensor domain-containing protein/serine phosphatase RsbU (regulator of sigma subunit)
MSKSSSQIILLFCCILLFSCSQQKEQDSPNSFSPKVIETKGYVVPQDSISEPQIYSVGKPIIVKAVNPKVVLTNTNIVVAGKPKIVSTRKPRVIILGQDTFLLPKTIPAISNPFLAGIPEVIVAKDAYVKDQNPQNFSSFRKLQGLKHDFICCVVEDKMGNLWIGSYGGVCKYDGKTFTHFTEKEGMSNNAVLSILEDKMGNLWFGTDGGGVSKYDGKSFTHFTKKEGLFNTAVLSILEDKMGNLWFATYGEGVSKYDGKTFTHFTEKEGLSNNNVMSILEDKFGNLWFGTDDGGVSKLVQSSVEGSGKYTITHFTEKEGLSSNGVMSILEDKMGYLWFGTNDGISKYDGKTFTHFTEKEGLLNNYVKSILEDKNGNLWFGTNNGISKYDGKTFTSFTEKEGLSNSYVRNILQDKSGNLWFGTNCGINKYDGKTFTHFTEKEGLSNNTIMAVLEDKKKNLWFSTNGLGISKYDGKTFTHFTEKEGLLSNTVISMLEDKNSNLWLGTYAGICKYDGKTFTSFIDKEGSLNNVFSILEDKMGNLWFGTFGMGLLKYDGKNFTHFTDKEGLPNNIVFSMLEDKNGNLWFGTFGGICKYDGKTFTQFTKKEDLANTTIMAILEDKNGILWFGTDGGGVTMYDGKAFTYFTEKEGLSNSTVLAMLEDKKGNLWFGTRLGLSKLTPKNKDKLVNLSGTHELINTNAFKGDDIKVFFKNYTYEDGFLGIGVNGGQTICEDKNGTIWIATNDRLTAFHPEGEVEDTIAPTIQLTSVALFNEAIDWTSLQKVENQESKESNPNIQHSTANIAIDTSFILGNGVNIRDFEFDGITKWYSLPENLSLAYNNNYLTFNFIGITQKQSKKVKYQYKLEGSDENWSAITTRTEAPYGNLPQGTYSFKVKAMNSEGYWSNEFNYTFTIRPPWWKTWWMYSIYGISVIATVFLIVWWNGRRLRARAIELTEEVEKATVVIREEKEKVELANTEISEQKKIVEEKHKEITDSINYAERIQRSFLASTQLLNENLNDYFIFFQPKDVVSGDFYWASKLSNGNFVLATADSTGHGVPGAIMSILNISSLEKAVEQGYTEPSEILGHTRKTIIERLKKDGSPEGGKDGMDASLICFDFNNQKLTYAAANNPIFVVRTGAQLSNGATVSETSLIELKPDKMPVGKSDKDQQPFTQNEFQLQKGDLVYTLTDGLQDQFGGPKGKKFMTKQLKELLISISFLPMQEQKLKLQQVFDDWKANVEQVDDVCLIGIRI